MSLVTGTVTRSVTLPADLDTAWELLTDPAELATWLGDADLRPEPGAAGHLVEEDGTRRRVVVDEVEEGRRLVWLWGEEDADGQVGAVSRVELVLAPEEDGTTRLVVTEEPAEPLSPQASAAHRARAGEAWSFRLLHLEALRLVAAAVRG